MSCEFCNNFDFTSVAVKENNIHTSGGSIRFTDAAYDNRPEFQLFQFCPICGCSLLYEKASANRMPAHSSAPVKVAVDCYGQRIPFAIEDDDCVMTEEEYYTITDLQADCGVSFSLAKDAYMYAKRRDGDYNMMVAYIKAKITAISVSDRQFTERLKFFLREKKYDL
jgi:hypothetical protein